jgi:hypothetical protein
MGAVGALGWAPCPSRAADVVINELRSTPGAGFVELYNQGNDEVDLSGWTLAGSVQLTFPQGTALAGRSYIVVASVPGTLAAEVPAGVPVLGWEQGDLSQGSLILAAPSVSGSVPVARADISEEARSASLELVHPGLPAALPPPPARRGRATAGSPRSHWCSRRSLRAASPRRG